MINRLIYKLKYKNDVYICKHEVSGYEQEGIKFGKASENKGIIKSYSSEIQLIGLDAKWISNVYLNYGVNEIVSFEVYSEKYMMGEQLEYSAFIHLPSLVINGNVCTFMLKEGGFITLVDNMIKKDNIIKDGYKSMLYSPNVYNFDIDLISETQTKAIISNDEIKQILPSRINDNNNNYEDIRIFEAANKGEVSTGVMITNDNCFIKINGQKFIDKLKFNFNIPTIQLGNVAYTTDTYRGLVRYKFQLMGYNNNKEEWGINDSSRIINKSYNVYLQYSIQKIINPYQFGIQTMKLNGFCLNPNNSYAFEEDIKQYLSGENYDNIKFILTVTPIFLYLYNQDNVLSEIEDAENFTINTKVDIKCTIKDFSLFPFTLINVWSVSDVYKKIMYSTRGTNNIKIDTSNIDNLNLYLTSASELCGDTQINTTLEQLLQFIYLATGYRHIIDYRDNVYYVYFEKYENSFKNVEIAKIENQSEVVIECEPDKIFTDIEVGWGNKDSGIFKSLEYNTINKFRTGYNNIESNIFTLSCNYSASITDIETIKYNAGYNDKQTNSKDVYVIEGYNDNGILKNVQYVGTSSNPICSNGSLTPSRILDVHKYELSDFLFHKNKLTFNSTNGLADITINGVKEDSDIVFNNQLMQPFIISIDGVINKSIMKVDANKYGYFTFMHKGEYIRGWIAEGSDSVSVAANGNVSKLRLIVNKETKI